MNVVVRTLHGDADIDIVSAPSDTTVGDLLVAVDGQAPPPVVRIDDRSVSTARRLSVLALAIGSVIDARLVDDRVVPRATSITDDTPPAPAPFASTPTGPAAVDLVQLTGRGAGSINRLVAGRYRIGPGRRLNADEMLDAPVESPAFEIRIDDRRGVFVSPGLRIGGPLSGVLTPTLDGELFNRELAWRDGRLNVGGRVFDIEEPATAPQRRRLAAPDGRGVIAFQRTPGPPETSRRPIIDARRRARAAGTGLWQRRRDDPDAYVIPFGLLEDETNNAVIDLQRHQGVAIVGSERFGAGIARTVLVELTTQHGPADLDIIVASTPERLGQWDWSKWLPHVRRGDPTATPALFSHDDELEAWAASLGAGGEGSTGDGPAGRTDRVTTIVVVLDDPALWRHRQSPLRALLVDPPAHVRVIALCGALHEAPATCSALIEEIEPDDLLGAAGPVSGNGAVFGSLATLHLMAGPHPQVIGSIRPALVEPMIAAEVARAIAPLDDLDLDRPLHAPAVAAAPTLGELVDLQLDGRSTDGVGGLAERLDWALTGSLPVLIGVLDQPSRTDSAESDRSERRPVAVDLSTAGVTLFSATEAGPHDTMIAALIMGATASRRPDELSVLTVGRRRPQWHDDVPHIAGHVDRDAPDDPSRVVDRVAHVLREEPDLEVLVIVEDAFERPRPATAERRAVPIDVATGMLELATAFSRVHLVLTTLHDPSALPDSVLAGFGTEIVVAGPDGDARGRLTSAGSTTSFIGPSRVASSPDHGEPLPAIDPGRLVIRPNIHGRAMTPLERRVSRDAPRTTVNMPDDPATPRVAHRIARSVDGGAPARQLLPPPLPRSVSMLALLDAHPGDGVPLGLRDRPDGVGNEAYWWQPGAMGSMLVVGSPRSGMSAVTDLLITGIAARLAADDLRVYGIEPLPQRRRAMNALPHTAAVATTDEAGAATEIIDAVYALLDERTTPTDPTHAKTDMADVADVVLIVGDVARLRRSLPDGVEDATMNRLGDIAEAGPAVGVNVVAVTTRVDDLGPLLRLSGDRLVGAVSDPSDRDRLGVPRPGPADRHPGRCWSVVAGRRVQIAAPPDSVEHEIARRGPRAPTARPPRHLVERGNT